MLNDVMSDEQVNEAIRKNAVVRISQALTDAVNNAPREEKDGNKRGMLDYRREFDEDFAGSIDFTVISEEIRDRLVSANKTCQWVGPDRSVVQQFASLLDIDPTIVSDYITMGWEVIKAAYPSTMVILNDTDEQIPLGMYFYADGIYFSVYLVAYSGPDNNAITQED